MQDTINCKGIQANHTKQSTNERGESILAICRPLDWADLAEAKASAKASAKANAKNFLALSESTNPAVVHEQEPTKAEGVAVCFGHSEAGYAARMWAKSRLVSVDSAISKRLAEDHGGVHDLMIVGVGARLCLLSSEYQPTPNPSAFIAWSRCFLCSLLYKPERST